MSLKLILGGSGVGKSHYLYEEMIRESMQNKDTNYIVIVPEQFTMQTQKDLVTMHPDNGILNIDILSFLRLAYRVFEETNQKNRLVLEDTGKSMILRKVIAAKKEELVLFQNNVRKQGFVTELKSLLSELYQYSIGPDELEEMVTKVKHKPMLASKLTDMHTIYEGFKEFLSDRYITAEEILDILCDVIEDSSMIKNSVICFDGYTGFTPIQYKLVSKLMVLCKKVIVTVTIDEREKVDELDEEFKLFHMSKKTIAKLCQDAADVGVPVEPYVFVNKGKVPYRFLESRELAALEHNLFRYPFRKYTEEMKDIRILTAKDPDGEVDFTVKEIMRLIQEEGYRYKDIAVVTGDLQAYGTKLSKEYEKVKIPHFLDLKKDLMSNPLVKLLRAILELLSNDFAYESVFRYLRNDLVDIEKEDVDILENYVIALGIRGFSSWNKEWVRIYKSKGELDLEYLNTLRTWMVDHVIGLREVLKKPEVTVGEITRAIYEFLVENQMEEKMERYRLTFEAMDEPLLAKEYKQVYPILMELLDKLVELLGDDVVTVKEYKELLESGLNEAKVGLIPPGIDQVMIGDIERTRLKDIKALFFVGVNDGIIPKASGQGGIISDMERELLAANHMVMAPTRRQSSYTEQFYLYLNLTKPTNRLYVSYSKVGGNGKSIRASYLIGKLMQIFPNICVEDLTVDTKENDILEVLGADRGLSYLIQGLREYKEEMPELWKEVFAWYKGKEEYGDFIELLIDGACYEKKEVSISKAVSKALYGEHLSNSVTRLERYAACAYAHFLSYGLMLSPRQEYQISAPDIGTIFHNAMETFAHKLHASEYDWTNLPEEAREYLVEESVKEASETFNNGILKSSKRNEYMIARVGRIAKRTVWALCEHVKGGDFVPRGFELQFSRLDNLESVCVPLEDGSDMLLQGRIDRVDRKEEGDQVYLRVIDYKTGNTSLDLSKMYHGLQLQLIVYLNAAMELEQKQEPEKVIIPAGIFYYNINDPLVEKQLDVTKQEGEEASGPWITSIQEELLKELKLNGLVNDNINIIKAMDHEFVDESEEEIKKSVKSKIIPVETTKDGSMSKRSSTVNNAQMQRICKYVMGKVKEFGNEIISGDIRLEPYKIGNFTACEYCDYKGICGFDQRLPGNTYRKLAKLKNEEVLERIKEYLAKGEDEDE